MKHTASEFAKLLHALSNDIVDAHIHWRLAKDLGTSLGQHPLVAAQSNTFWYLTHKAHIATALQCLCRAFDQEQSSLHLLSWLQIIKNNSSVFDVENFRERIKDNPFVESLVESAQQPSIEVLDKDIASCRNTDSTVNLLVRYRGAYAAHRSKKKVLKPSKSTANQLLTDSVIETLLDRAKTIFNRYSYMFAAATYSTTVVGKHDYKYIFTAVEREVKRGRA